jgi:hypothetical protein
MCASALGLPESPAFVDEHRCAIAKPATSPQPSSQARDGAPPSWRRQPQAGEVKTAAGTAAAVLKHRA